MSPTMALIAMGVPEHHSLWTAWLYGHPNGGVVRLLANSIPRRRAMVSVQVGRSMGRFETMRLGHAIYGTGWDGNIDVTTWGDGRLQGETAHEERSESRSVADLIPRRLR